MLTRQQAKTDLVVVGGCCCFYVAASLLSVPVAWIVTGVVLVLAFYGQCVLKRRAESWRDYGVRSDNIGPAGRPVGIWTAIVIAIMVIIAWRAGHSFGRPEMFILLAIYPCWGIVQQFVFQGVLHRALMTLMANKPVIIFLNAIAFATVHIADLRVTGLTFVAGLCWSWFYQHWPNIWVLGISHGITGALVYPLVLNENPLSSFFWYAPN